MLTSMPRRRRLRRLVLLVAGLGGVAAWRERALARNRQRYKLP
jgi:tRNA A37 threonylcarbamoyladenosine dehydratase